jgi:hypothetical protein
MVDIKKIFSIDVASVKKTLGIARADMKKVFGSDRPSEGTTTTTTVTGCDLDGLFYHGGGAHESWSDCINATESNQDFHETHSQWGVYLHSFTGRGPTSFDSNRAYFRFAIPSATGAVSAATFKVWVHDIDNSSDADVNKWKIFKHRDNAGDMEKANYRNDGETNSDGWDQTIGSSEVTVSSGGYVDFPITGDLLSYVSTQCQAGAAVAFMLVCKLDYTNTAPSSPPSSDSITIRYTDYTGTTSDPQLVYTHA